MQDSETGEQSLESIEETSDLIQNLGGLLTKYIGSDAVGTSEENDSKEIWKDLEVLIKNINCFTSKQKEEKINS